MDHLFESLRIMQKAQLSLAAMFLINCWVYFQFHHIPHIAQTLQAVIALTCIACVAYFKLTLYSLPFASVILFTGILLPLGLTRDLIKWFMCIPLVLTLGPSVLKKHWMICQVLGQSMWMFLSVIASFCMFGFVSFYLFSSNEEYFGSPVKATLTYLQMSTLDQVGKVVMLNYESYGFSRSFSVMVASLAIFHVLFNINQAFVVQFIYNKRHNTTAISSLKHLTATDVTITFKVLRIINLVTTSMVFLFLFHEGYGKWIYLTLSTVSFLCVLGEHLLEGSLKSPRNVANIILQISIIALFVSKLCAVCFLVCVFRVFVLREVISLWRKIGHVLWEISPLFSLAGVFFLVFSLSAFSLKHMNGIPSPIGQVFIQALQFMTLDDWTSHLRKNSWMLSLLIVVYIVLLNHVLLNAIISQSFCELDHLECRLPSHRPTRLFRFQNEHNSGCVSIDEEQSADEFWKLGACLGYSLEYMRDRKVVLKGSKVCSSLDVDDKI